MDICSRENIYDKVNSIGVNLILFLNIKNSISVIVVV